VVKIHKGMLEHNRTNQGRGYSYKYVKFTGKVKTLLRGVDDCVTPPTVGHFVIGEDVSSWLRDLYYVAQRITLYKGEVGDTLSYIKDCVDQYDPLFVQFLEEAMAKQKFNPGNVERVEIDPRPEFPKMPSAIEPTYSAKLASTLLELDSLYDCFDYPFSTTMLINEEYDISLRFLRGKLDSLKAYYETLALLNLNQCDPKREANIGGFRIDIVNEIQHALDSKAHRLGVELCEPRTVSFEYQEIYDILKGMNTSLGWYHKKIYLHTTTGRKRVLNCKKEDIAAELAREVVLYLEMLQLFLDGKGPEPIMPSINTENNKIEYVSLDFVNKSMTFEEYESYLNKTRIFYIGGVMTFIFQKLLFRDLPKKLCGYRFGIGMKVEAGGIQKLASIMTGDVDSPLHQVWKDAVEEARAYGVDLSKRKYAQGDLKKMDQTILAMFLCAFATFQYTFVKRDEDNMTQESWDYIYHKTVMDIVLKCCNMYGFNAMMMIWGTMFSGAFVTSQGDSFILDIVWEMYLNRLVTAYPGNPILLIIMKAQMNQFAVFGDDHNAGYPEYMDDNFKLYDDSENMMMDFCNFFSRELGLIAKTEELKIFDSFYAFREFITIGDGIYKLVSEVPGPVFIRNSASVTMLDGVVVGIYPYQETFHLISKMKGLVATQSATMAICLVTSLARLSSGNLEAYSMFSIIYDALVTRYGVPAEDEWRQFLKLKQGRSLGSLVRSGNAGPEFPLLCELWAIQDAGYNSGLAWAPKKRDLLSTTPKCIWILTLMVFFLLIGIIFPIRTLGCMITNCMWIG